MGISHYSVIDIFFLYFKVRVNIIISRVGDIVDKDNTKK